MLERRIAVTGPGQAEVVAGEVIPRFLVLAASGLKRFHIEQMHVAHVRLESLRALAGVTDGPHPGVDLAQDVLRHGLVHTLDLLHLVVLGQFFPIAQFVCKLLHDHVIATTFPQGFNHFFTPLNGAVGRSH